MKNLVTILILSFCSFAASAQIQSHSTIQRITIHIQKSTILEFKEAKKILADSTVAKADEKIKLNMRVKEDLIMADDETTTYFRVKEDVPAEDVDAFVVTKSAI